MRIKHVDGTGFDVVSQWATRLTGLRCEANDLEGVINVQSTPLIEMPQWLCRVLADANQGESPDLSREMAGAR